MPIDNTTLLKYQGSPPKPPTPREAWVVPTVLIGGTAILTGSAALAWGDVVLTRVVVVACLCGAGVWWILRLLAGWNEDGLLGLFYRDRNPMGSMLVGDEERDGLAIAWWVLSSMAVIVAVVLLAGSPGAIPQGWTTPTPPVGAGGGAPAGSQ